MGGCGKLQGFGSRVCIFIYIYYFGIMYLKRLDEYQEQERERGRERAERERQRERESRERGG